MAALSGGARYTAPVDMTYMAAFLIQDGSYIDACRSEMTDEYGSIEGYIRRGLGLSDQEVQQLQVELLE